MSAQIAKSQQITEEQLSKLKSLGFEIINSRRDEDVTIEEGQCKLVLGEQEYVSTEGLGPCLGIIIKSKEPSACLGIILLIL